MLIDACRFIRPGAFVSKTCSEQNTLFGAHRTPDKCSLTGHQEGDKQEAITDGPVHSMDYAACSSRVWWDSVAEGMCREHVATSCFKVQSVSNEAALDTALRH